MVLGFAIQNNNNNNRPEYDDMLFCCCLVSVLQRLNRLNHSLFCFDVSGSNYSNVVSFECDSVSMTSLGQTEPELFFKHIHTWTQTPLAAALFTVQASLLIATLKEQRPAMGSLSFEVNCVPWPTIPLTSALYRLLWWCIWAETTVKCNWEWIDRCTPTCMQTQFSKSQKTSG